MMKVADGLLSGTQILEHFGGNRKKKVYLYLPPGKVHVFFLIPKNKSTSYNEVKARHFFCYTKLVKLISQMEKVKVPIDDTTSPE